jgi:hypothetical protein
MINAAFVYSRIGMAIISAQRVEYITGELLSHLTEFDETLYCITTAEFLYDSKRSLNARKTLGQIFKLLKLNPKIVIQSELDDYLKKRNQLVHGFWKNYLNSKSQQQAKKAVKFCDEFGELSTNIESFFKGFIYFLGLRHVQNRSQMGVELKKWEKDFEYFIGTLIK